MECFPLITHPLQSLKGPFNDRSQHFIVWEVCFYAFTFNCSLLYVCLLQKPVKVFTKIFIWCSRGLFFVTNSENSFITQRQDNIPINRVWICAPWGLSLIHSTVIITLSHSALLRMRNLYFILLWNTPCLIKCTFHIESQRKQ